MTARKARNIVKEFLVEKDIPYTTLKARTIDFTDLAREKVVFVRIGGWIPNPEAWQALKALAKKHGFCVEAY